jgi:hypothetical protein
MKRIKENETLKQNKNIDINANATVNSDISRLITAYHTVI